MGVTSGLRRPAACPVALSGARRHAALRAHSLVEGKPCDLGFH